MTLQELFSDKSKWTKGFYAKTRAGRHVDGRDSRAVCWCLEGGLILCCTCPEERDKVSTRIEKHLGITNLVLWNDAPERTFEDIKNLVTTLDI